MIDKRLLSTIEKNTRGIYERNARLFDIERSKELEEKSWLDRFSDLLPKSAKVLDVGCGAGEPIARYLIRKGFAVEGLDFSTTMLEIIRGRFPDQTWHRMDMRTMSMGTRFDGIIAWHSFFHLNHDDQELTLHKFVEHLEPEGVLLITVGDRYGEVVGRVGEEEVYHASFSLETYEKILTNLQMRVLDFACNDPDCGMASVLLAQKES
mgnify:CR=1 FL=1